MLNRRELLTSGVTAGGFAALCATDRVQAARANPSGVDGYTYRLPSFKTGSRLLFQGDSITDMKWGRNQKDRNHYLGHSYVYLIAARLGVDMPEAQLDIYNRGISGNAVSDLRKRWQADALEMHPDLLSILIGINDVGHSPEGVDLAAWEADYRFILEASRAANATLRLVLLDPFTTRTGQMREQVERLIPVVQKLAEDFDAVHIKTQAVFDAASKVVSPEHWVWDGVHPLPQGHELIARHWLQEVSARWGV